jgi:hypothetical protein
MYMQTKYFIFIISCCTIFSSCGTYPCAEAQGLRISPVSFTEAERDTIVFRKFVKNGSFTSLLDTTIITADNAVFKTSNDTANMVAAAGILRLVSKYDYEIYIPAVNRLTKITDIIEPQLEGNNKSIFNTRDILCGNSIQSYKKDGQLLTAKEFNLDFCIY